MLLCLLPLPFDAAVEVIPSVTDRSACAASRRGDRSSVRGNPLFLFELLEAVRTSGGGGAAGLDRGAHRRRDRPALARRPDDPPVRGGAGSSSTRTACAVDADARRSTAASGRGCRPRELDGTPRLRFRNSLIRETAYEGLPYRRRRPPRSGRRGDRGPCRLVDRREVGALRCTSSRLSAGEGVALLPRRRPCACHLRQRRGYRFYERALVAGRGLRSLSDDDRAGTWKALGAAREAAGSFDLAFEAYQRASRLLRHDPVSRSR